MLFVYIEMSLKIFLYINVNNNDSYQQKTTCTFIYIQKAKKLRNIYIYRKIKTICVTFLLTKSRTLYVTRFFIIFLKLEFIYIQKAWHFALHDVFIYKKLDTSKKARQFTLRILYKKAWNFALRNFPWNFWNWRRGGAFL